jgi:hypothetical protein
MPRCERHVAISFNRRPYSKAFLLAAAAAMVGIGLSQPASASVTYGYDPLGRVNTALYDNGVCVVYAYDMNGNRTSQTNTSGGAPETATWGTGSWGCFYWTP